MPLRSRCTAALTQDDLRCTVYSLANMATQLAGGDPISPDVLAGHAMTALSLGLGNAAQHVVHHLAQRGPTHSGSSELIGIVDFVVNSDDDLLVTTSSLGSNSDSSIGSHHPSQECFMAGTPDGFVEEDGDSPKHPRDCTPPPASAPA